MRRREFEKTYGGNHRPFIIEQYESFSELIDTCKGRKTNFGHTVRESGHFDSPNFVGCQTYQEASDMLRYGWHDEEKIKHIKNKVNDLTKQQEVEKTSFENDIVGFAPIVPNAIIGIPQNMLNSTRKAKKNKVITILADMTTSAGTEKEKYLEWGAKLISKIVQLEKNGFRVRLEYVNVFAEEDREKVHVCRVLMKNENQPFDVKRYMFPLAHTAMFRGLMFDWYEKLPNAESLSGYGCSLIHHEVDEANFIKNEICQTDDCYYIVCKEDVNEVLKDVK